MNTGYIAGDNGTVLKTTNGTVWQRLNTPTTSNLYTVFFIDIDNGYAAGENIILKTFDGGSSWTVYNALNSPLKSVFFININTGYCVGYNGVYYQTTNAGSSWQKQIFDPMQNYNAIYFMNGLTGFIAGNGGVYLKTIDGGNNWINKKTNVSKNLYSIQFPNSSTGYITGGYAVSTILKSNDVGENWGNLLNDITGVRLFSGYFTNANTGFVVGRYGVIQKTINGGTNWTDETSGTGEYLFSINFASPAAGYIAGANGTILSTIAPIGIIPIVNEVPKYFRLYQNFPNPFNPVTKIRFDIPNDGINEFFNVSFVVYDIEGRKVADIINNQLIPGAYNIEWDFSNLASGSYFYKLQAGEYVETKKMVLIK